MSLYLIKEENSHVSYLLFQYICMEWPLYLKITDQEEVNVSELKYANLENNEVKAREIITRDNCSRIQLRKEWQVITTTPNGGEGGF